MSELFHRATQNIGDPPHADAYCRCLAMEVERLARADERAKMIQEKQPGPGETRRYKLPDTFDGIRFEIGRIVKMIQEAKKDLLVIETARKIAALSTSGRKIKTEEDRRFYTLKGIHAWCKDNFVYVDDPANIELIQTPNRMLRSLQIPPQLHMAMWKPIAKELGGNLPRPRIAGDSDEAATLVLALLAAVGFEHLKIRCGGTDDVVHYVWGGVETDGYIYDLDILHPKFDSHYTKHLDDIEVRV
jgi:hypothetical protein